MVMLTISLLLCAAVALSGATVLELFQDFEQALHLGAKGAEEGVVAAENRNQCPTGWFQFGSRCFMFVETARSWPLAERHCVSLGANLASLHSSAEYQFLQEVVESKTGGFSTTWIGGFDAVQDRLWFWSDGSEFDYQNWKKGEPNNSGGREPCIVINWGDEYRWNDINCRNIFPSVCSKRICEILKN
ncbi:ladderlectin isoform X1 [Salvelinus namaycush]|uniref:Ladderlectin isoform X1 n=1 Tax=Salvelinus namaycush TaxID=8040 RepID=A0A8U0TNC2_SALNM|nr:ladderlectin isoform X1 [Salvelinus namaycush]